ncbi:MAG: DUF4268 domain-containing protein [Leptospirales bacterium]
MRSGEISEVHELQLRYWTAFKRFLQENGIGLQVHTPRPQNWLLLNIGKPGFSLCSTILIGNGRIGAELYISLKDNKRAFYSLQGQRSAIEREFGEGLEWQQEVPRGRASRIVIYKTDVNIQNQNDWTNQFNWLSSALVRLDKVFRQKINSLKSSPAAPDPSSE